jgi:hypothetical protein
MLTLTIYFLLFLVNDNEKKVTHHLDHIEHHQIQLHMKQMLDTIKFQQKHPRNILMKQNALEIRQLTYQQNLLHQINKTPRPKNYRHELVKGLRNERKLSCRPVMQRMHKHRHLIMIKNKIYLPIAYQWFQKKF